VKLPKNVYNGHGWNRSALLQVLIAIVSLLSMVLASGAGSQWF
jgi:hypothetical protein